MLVYFAIFSSKLSGKSSINTVIQLKISLHLPELFDEQQQV